MGIGERVSVPTNMVTLRNLICWLLVVLTPASLVAADSEAAMLYGDGIVLRNGTQIPGSTAIFSGDLVETRVGAANLTVTGSSVNIHPVSLVVFEGESVSVEHGGVSVATAHGISVRVRCMTVVPVTNAWTEFEVADVNGTIEVAARKNDVRLEPANGSAKQVSASREGSVLHEGQQASRDESDGCKGEGPKKNSDAAPAGTRSPFSSDYFKYAVAGGVAGLGTWLVLEHDDPPSPYKP